MVRLGPMRLPQTSFDPSNVKTVLIPDGLQHSKFTCRRSGRGAYVFCSREVIQQLQERGVYKRVVHKIVPHTRLADHVAHLLRLRILQELQLLVDHFEAQTKSRRKISVFDSAIRRLTRAELRQIKTTGTISHPDAIAILAVPPPNRDPVTKERPQGLLSAAPPNTEPSQGLPPLPPVTVLYPSDPDYQSTLGEPSIHSQRRTPLYSGLALFPNQSQRAACHSLLKRLADLGHTLFKPTNVNLSTELTESKSDRKGSHAFLVCSNGEIAKHFDVAALAVALWRLQMFEGGSLGASDDGWSW